MLLSSLQNCLTLVNNKQMKMLVFSTQTTNILTLDMIYNMKRSINIIISKSVYINYMLIYTIYETHCHKLMNLKY